jgi:phage terminase small subunit
LRGCRTSSGRRQFCGKKAGFLVKGRHANEAIPNPLLRIIRGQAVVMFRAAEQLGFSPTARARVRRDSPLVDDGGWSEIS